MKKFFDYFEAMFLIVLLGYIVYIFFIPESEESKQVKSEIKANIGWFESQSLIIKNFFAEPTGVYELFYPDTHEFYGGNYYDYNFNKDKLNELVELFKEDSWTEFNITEEYMQDSYPGVYGSITENSIILCKNNTGILFHMNDVKAEVVLNNGKRPNTLISIIHQLHFPCFGLAE